MERKEHIEKTLPDFKPQIETIKKKGFNLIGITQIMFEDTFIFKTSEEATKAYIELERDNPILSGWWYGKDELIKTLKDYDTQIDTTRVKIFWL